MEKIGEHGFVRLVDTMPRYEEPADGELSPLDRAVVQAARVSYAGGTKTTRGDRGLIRYLLRHAHTTPFEMIEFKFHFKMPMFVARQHLRHRTVRGAVALSHPASDSLIVMLVHDCAEKTAAKAGGC